MPKSTEVPLEPMVGPAEVAKHLGFKAPSTIIRMAKAGVLPAVAFHSGRKTYYRFYLTEVDAAMKSGQPASAQNRSFQL